MTCPGPDEDLLRAATLHAGCTVEWYIHAGLWRMMTIAVMYVLMNVSREFIMSGALKLTWRSVE